MLYNSNSVGSILIADFNKQASFDLFLKNNLWEHFSLEVLEDVIG